MKTIDKRLIPIFTGIILGLGGLGLFLDLNHRSSSISTAPNSNDNSSTTSEVTNSTRKPAFSLLRFPLLQFVEKVSPPPSSPLSA